jgi:hypothetical protein
VQLANTEEFVDGQSTGMLGEVLISLLLLLLLAVLQLASTEEFVDGQSTGMLGEVLMSLLLLVLLLLLLLLLAFAAGQH